MHTYRSQLQIAGLLVALIFLVLSSLRSLQQVITLRANASSSEQIALYERRAAQLSPLLPSSGAVGYMSDRDNPSAFFRNYYILRYIYAPLTLLVVGDMPHDPYGSLVPVASDSTKLPALIVGDFHDRQRLEAYRSSLDLLIVAQADDTLFLLCRRGARDAQGAVCQ
jgi:hypothetical protein